MKDELRKFRGFGKETVCTKTVCPECGVSVETFVNEFWTARQRDAHSLHEISYRACFKPQLPRFFIERLTSPGETVYDPFMGRGTTLLEAALLGRVPFGCDANPLCSMLIEPRLEPPSVEEIEERLKRIDLHFEGPLPEDLLVFYHPDTLRELCALRKYFASGKLSPADRWVRMVALNRLTGHSKGFFSVYTLPPNQAVSVESQRKINRKRQQVPEYKDVRSLIQLKTRALLADCAGHSPFFLGKVRLFTASSAHTPGIGDASVSLAVTSPPFLDVVDYETDNWLRNWFASVDPSRVNITMERTPEGWSRAMEEVFRELYRVLKPGGHLTFEVGEVNKGKLRMEELVLPCGIRSGFTPVLILINAQEFTKTANCWGVANNEKGTNTNRVVLFRKES